MELLKNNMRLLHAGGLWVIRVFGEPQPEPKKQVGINAADLKKLKSLRGGIINIPRLIPIDIDYRTRKNKITGKTEKYDKGYKKKWFLHVRNTVLCYMVRHGLKPYTKNHPLCTGYLFFRTKPKSCKLPYPSQRPDFDNYEYYVTNALKRTREKKIRGIMTPGEYPDGVAFWDDDEPVWNLPAGVMWATEENPPGVIILIQDAMKVRNEIDDQVKYIASLAG